MPCAGAAQGSAAPRASEREIQRVLACIVFTSCVPDSCMPGPLNAIGKGNEPLLSPFRRRGRIRVARVLVVHKAGVPCGTEGAGSMSYTTPDVEIVEPGGPVNINHKAGQPAGGAQSGDGVSALERLPHITKRVCLLWGHPEFDAFTSHLLMDSRDGKRQGLPWEVAEELLFLAELRVVKRAIIASGVTGQPFWEVFNQMLANAEAAQQRAQHEWS